MSTFAPLELNEMQGVQGRWKWLEHKALLKSEL